MKRVIKSIPGYGGKYLISLEDSMPIIVNNKGHVVKPIQTMRGTCVELYHLGQRELIPIKDLMERTFHEGT